jgi:hypothetical protein
VPIDVTDAGISHVGTCRVWLLKSASNFKELCSLEAECGGKTSQLGDSVDDVLLSVEDGGSWTYPHSRLRIVQYVHAGCSSSH